MICAFDAAVGKEGFVELSVKNAPKEPAFYFVMTPTMARTLATQLMDAARRSSWKDKVGNKKWNVE